MATYAIGDVQGCAAELSTLLDRINFDPSRDRLWFAGDLINRGSENLSVMRLVKGLGTAASTVLGNHDLHFLAIHFGANRLNSSDTFGDVLEAPDVDELAHWLRRQPMLLRDDELGFALTHAGVPHIWTLEDAHGYAGEVESVLAGPHYVEYCRTLYGNKPDCWDPANSGMERWRLITNYFTRMRLVQSDGRLDFRYTGSPEGAPKPFKPWYSWAPSQPRRHRLLFGHWAALNGITRNKDCIALDTGCVWGRLLTAYCLESGKVFSVQSYSDHKSNNTA